MDKSESEITLQTCSNTDIPPVPNINTVISNFKNIFELAIPEIKLAPLVSSIKPNRADSIQTLLIKKRIPETLIIEITKEKIITKPQTVLNV